MPSENLILITGATGHIGFRTLLTALQHGHHVRAAIRSPDKSSKITSNPAILALNLPPNALTFTTVPDLTVEGAYDEAVKDVTGIIHVASPIPSSHLTRDPSEAEELFIRPAVQGTLNLLSAAHKSATVKRVVITSSMVATMHPRFWGGVVDPPPGTVYDSSSRTEPPPPPFPKLEVAYCTSKIASLNESEAWLRRTGPRFSVVNVHPGFVLGPDLLQESAEDMKRGTNMMVLGIAFGDKNEGRRAGSAVHVDDVAKLHVESLDLEKVAVRDGESRSFLAHVPGRWERVAEIVAEEFEEAVKKDVLKADGVQVTTPIKIDAKETEEVFGITFVPFEEQVREVLGRYVELAGKA